MDISQLEQQLITFINIYSELSTLYQIVHMKENVSYQKQTKLKLEVTPWLHRTEQKLCGSSETWVLPTAFGHARVTEQIACEFLIFPNFD